MSVVPGLMISHRSRAIAVQVIHGHFATGHSHVNYYIDLTHAKDRHGMAKEIGLELASQYVSTDIDTILCRDGTKMIGAFLADELSRQSLLRTNDGGDINVVKPEADAGGHLIFRENNLEMIRDKNVLMLVSSVSTGRTINSALDCLKYYGGRVAGISALFSIVPEISGYPVNAVFTNEDIPDYRSYTAENCELCQQQQSLDGIVNSFGFSRL